ncbi:CRAL/TRIO domain-containing protein [Besnoitia besnoiti]|uniref:CRAL/TRIO domain-containing protein n=1 Tax=Besnoitia besnoiti TaxID=94643 RepID=A0A2A9M830_BESBE|nr:CRAL/TRIO domain-containing protein [Besnoitia besnoiti]PFH34079.1 CRAL/TRIO domain-containing protein [Besnoitia besnoiti]
MNQAAVLALLVFHFFTVVLPICLVLLHVLLGALFILFLVRVMPQGGNVAALVRGLMETDVAEATEGEGVPCSQPAAGPGDRDATAGENAFHALWRVLSVYRRTFRAERSPGDAGERRPQGGDEGRGVENARSSQIPGTAWERGLAGGPGSLPSPEHLLPYIPADAELVVNAGENEAATSLRRRKEDVYTKLHNVLLGLPPPIVTSVQPPPYALPLDALLFNPTASHTHLRFPRAQGHPLLLRQIFLHVPLSRREQRWLDALHVLLKQDFGEPFPPRSSAAKGTARAPRAERPLPEGREEATPPEKPKEGAETSELQTKPVDEGRPLGGERRASDRSTEAPTAAASPGRSASASRRDSGDVAGRQKREAGGAEAARPPEGQAEEESEDIFSDKAESAEAGARRRGSSEDFSCFLRSLDRQWTTTPLAEGETASLQGDQDDDDFESFIEAVELSRATCSSAAHAAAHRGMGSKEKKGAGKGDAPAPYPSLLEPALLRVLWLIFRKQSRKFAPPGPPESSADHHPASPLGATPAAQAHKKDEPLPSGASRASKVILTRDEEARRAEGAAEDERPHRAGEGRASSAAREGRGTGLKAGEAKGTDGRYADSGMTEEEEVAEARELAREAAAHVGKMVAFRREVFPLSDRETALAKDLQKGLLYWCGRDVAMRPVLVLNLLKLDAEVMELSRFLRLLLFVFEWGLRYLMVPGKVETCVVLLDLREVSLWSLPYSCLQTLVQTLTLQYPFRLRKMFVLHDSRLINGMWNLAKAFLTDVQQAKVATFKVEKGKQNPQLTEELLHLVHPSQLEAKFGGTRPNIADDFYPFPLAPPEPLLRRSKTGAVCKQASDLLTSFGVTWDGGCRLPVQWSTVVAAAILRSPAVRQQSHLVHLASAASLNSWSSASPSALPSRAERSSSLLSARDAPEAEAPEERNEKSQTRRC